MASTFAESKFVARLKRALELDCPYPERLLRPATSKAAVLALLAPLTRGDTDQPALLVIKRAESTHPGDLHGGQMALPGGRAEPFETDLSQTALRETLEEVGIESSLIQLIGQLPPLTSISNYEVYPYVAITEVDCASLVLRLDKSEVAQVVWVPWSVLVDPLTYQKEMIERGSIRFPTHVYHYEGHRIWGATGAMLKNLLDRWAKSG